MALTDDFYAYEVDQDRGNKQSLEQPVFRFLYLTESMLFLARNPEVFLDTLNKSYNEWFTTNPQPGLQITSGESCSTAGCDY